MRMMKDNWVKDELKLIIETDFSKLTWEEIKEMFPDKGNTELIKKLFDLGLTKIKNGSIYWKEGYPPAIIKEKPKIKSINRDDLPDALSPKHIQEILGISRKKTYGMLEDPPFHALKLGRLIKISKKSFFKWFDGE